MSCDVAILLVNFLEHWPIDIFTNLIWFSVISPKNTVWQLLANFWIRTLEKV